MAVAARTFGGVRQAFSRVSSRHAVHEPDYWLMAIVMTLVMFGTVMIFSASYAMEVRNEAGNGYYYLMRQLSYLGIGIAAMLIVMRVDYHFWRRFSVPAITVVMLVLAAMVFVPGLGIEVWGAERWIKVGPISFQPSELAKLALVIYLADWLSQKGAKVRNFSYGLLPFAIVLGLLIGLVMLQPDLGTSTLLAAIGISMFLVAGAHLLQFTLLIATGSVAFLALALGASYRRDRILIFLDPESDLQNLGWQLHQARIALGSGGLFGLGLGASRQKYEWLPAAHNDAIFAVIGEELGLLGCAFVLLLFTGLAWRGYRVATRAPDAFGSLVAVGIVTWMIFQAAFNIGGITTTVPFTGIPLPFISYGGTSLIISLVAMGLLLSISRQTVTADRGQAGAVDRDQTVYRRPPRWRRVSDQRAASHETARTRSTRQSTGTAERGIRTSKTRAGSFGRGLRGRSSGSR